MKEASNRSKVAALLGSGASSLRYAVNSGANTALLIINKIKNDIREQKALSKEAKIKDLISTAEQFFRLLDVVRLNYNWAASSLENIDTTKIHLSSVELINCYQSISSDKIVLVNNAHLIAINIDFYTSSDMKFYEETFVNRNIIVKMSYVPKNLSLELRESGLKASSLCDMNIIHGEHSPYSIAVVHGDHQIVTMPGIIGPHVNAILEEAFDGGLVVSCRHNLARARYDMSVYFSANPNLAYVQALNKAAKLL